ncbi:MAG: hypothetical protein HQL15_03920 [Candidatus Omnitrophica bacterium]|nr:hypothetical protein [Candidatus Omnitrophota bacterium]
MKTHHYKEAIDTFNQALVLTPRNVKLLNDIGLCYIQEGDKLQAEQYFKMALGLNPSYKEARKNLDQIIDYQATQ